MLSDGGSFLYLDGSASSTNDVYNDLYSSSCAKTYSSGWWFQNGFSKPINPNGINYDYAKMGDKKSIHWYRWGDKKESLKSISMAIRKASLT